MDSAAFMGLFKPPNSKKPKPNLKTDEEKKATREKYEQSGRNRSFHPGWLDEFKWLEYDDAVGMKCTICKERETVGSYITGCKNYKKTSLQYHELSDSHIENVKRHNALINPESTQAAATLRQLTKKTVVQLSLKFRNVHYLCKKGRPYVDYILLCHLDEVKGLDIGDQYRTNLSATEFASYIAQAERDKIRCEISKSKFVSAISDGTTDCSIQEAEIVYVRTCRNGKIEVFFSLVKNVAKGDAASICQVMVAGLENLCTDYKTKLVGTGTDGASTMLGAKSGAVQRLRELTERPFIIGVHCSGHKLELAFKDTLKSKINLYAKLELFLLNLYYFYRNSNLTRSGLKDSFKALNMKHLLPTRVGGTRWVGHIELAIQTFLRGYRAIVQHQEQQPQVILLKEGTDSSQGIPQIVSNINACGAIADAVRTTLGPRGMDKLIVDDRGKATISNDGATILKTLDIVHPAAKTLVDIAKSQDAEVGDGTTSVVLLAGEFLKQAKPFIEENVHPQILIKAFRRAAALAVEKIKELAVQIKRSNPEEQKQLLLKCAATSLSSKLVAHQKEFFSNMVVDAVMLLDELLPLNMIGIKKVTGGALEDSRLVAGVAFKKTFSYAGFEMQPKKYTSPKIALLNIELELKAEKENAEVRVDNVEEYQAIVDAEWKILYDKLEKIHASGAKVVLSKLPIGDVATQYFADRDMFCAGRVPDEDLKRTMKACGGSIQTSGNNLTNEVLGTCELFEEIQVGGERYNLFTGCPQARTCTLLLRGGAEQFIEETERSLHDAIMIVRRAMKNDSVVAGGGAIEMELSKYLRDYSRTIAGKEQLLIGALAKALEVIPRQLCENAGFDATNILNKLRQSHSQGGRWYGVDVLNEDIADNFEAFVWEPAVVKINALTAASEATCLILSVDETIRNPKSNAEGGGGMGRGRGRPM